MNLLNAIVFTDLPVYAQILIPAGILFVLGAVFAVLLAFLSNKFKVSVDERVTDVRAHLSGANCGGCGFAGCDAFAEALVKGEASVSSCNATSKENKAYIAALLGSGDAGEETVYVVKCNGGTQCKEKYDYQGYGDCQSMQLLAGGRKACPVGCMAAGTCTNVCHHNAAEIDNNKGYSNINLDKCVNCGVCASHCPKKLIQPVPKSAKYYVACSNHEKGKDVRSYCKAGCIGCGMCARNCSEGAITVVDNLAVIDYTKCIGCGKCAEKCPSKCIKKVFD
ncbi:MAG: RnfABCDGE type electron transport complex subunit B [Clostridia bacterium]|nr:RnfABCDGE type electron transport complex subunit B [Clostridia bacterium]